MNAARALGRLGDKRAVEPLLASLLDGDAKVHEQAAKALGQLGDYRAVEPLIAALTGQDWAVRFEAAKALGRLGDYRAVEPLIAALEYKDWGFCWHVARALGQLGKPATNPLIAELEDENQKKIVRRSAAYALGRLGDKQSVQPLLDVLKDEDPRVRLEAAFALGYLGDPRSMKPLVAALKDENWQVRWNAVVALGALGNKGATETLLEMLNGGHVRNSEEGNFRNMLISTLGQLGDDRAVQPLIAVLRNKKRYFNDDTGESYGYIRKNAAITLGQLGDKRALEPLFDSLKDEEVRYMAAVGLAHLGDKRALEPLLDALKDEEARYMAALGLGQLGDKRAMELLLDTLKDEDEAMRYMAGTVLGDLDDRRAAAPLIAALKDESRKVRRIAAKALGQLRDERAIPDLQQLISRDADEYICNTATASLKNIRAWSLADSDTRLDEAERLVKKAIALQSNTPTFYDTLGWVFYKQGKYTEAIAAFENAIEGHPKLASAHYHLGLACLKNSQRQKALDELKTAFDLDVSYRKRVEHEKVMEKFPDTTNSQGQLTRDKS